MILINKLIEVLGCMSRVKVDYTNSGNVFIGLLLISIIAFWPTYYSVFFSSDFYIHLHAFFAVLWFGMLIVQPYLIKSRKLNIHRLIGKVSYIIAPLVVISILLLAHESIKYAPEEVMPIRIYILYLQLSLAFLFGVIYLFAIYFRKTKAIHSRFMAATALTFVDPIFARLLFIIAPNATFNRQWITFGLINLILIILSVIDRKNRKTKWVYPILLLIFIIIEIPIFFDLTGQDWWQAFATWFGSL